MAMLRRRLLSAIAGMICIILASTFLIGGAGAATPAHHSPSTVVPAAAKKIPCTGSSSVFTVYYTDSRGDAKQRFGGGTGEILVDIDNYGYFYKSTTSRAYR